MIAFVYSRNTSRTGRYLGRSFGQTWGTPNVVNRRQQEVETLVRWGCSAPLPFEAEHEVNPAGNIRLAADKYMALEVMTQEGVRTVPYSRSPMFGGIVMRRSDRHRGGTDILYGPATDFEPAPGVHYTQYIPARREMRLHVFCDSVFRSQLKVGGNLDADERFENVAIRNHANGYTFSTYTNTVPNQDRQDAAVGAVKALGLTFGAVDLLVSVDNDVYVLEVNTAPSCDLATATAYMEQFGGYLGCTWSESELQPLSQATEGEEDVF